jgi:ketosteroid isomerase-like protein
VERLRTIYDLFSREEFDEAARFAHPDVELFRVGESPLHGAKSVRAWMEPEALEEHRVEPLRFTTNGPRVLVWQRNRARGAGSGAEVSAELWVVWTFDDEGLATRVEVFLEEAPALEAAGLAKASRVETMSAALEAFNRRDASGFSAVLAENAEIVPVRAAVEGTTYRGPDAGSLYCAAVEDAWEDLHWEVEEIREGDGCVLALGRIRGRGRDSGVEIDANGGWLATFEGDVIARFQTFPERARALEAAGMDE